MQYICVLYIHDPNYIKGIPIKSRKIEELLRAYKEVCAYCENRGFTPQLHKMDKKTSRDVEDFIGSQQIGQQYTPPYTHQTKPSERSIQSYKSCIESTVASLPPKFPITYWCRLIPQVDFSINIVRKCRQIHLLSGWYRMEGEYHFDATPVAPPGSEMLMHKKPNRRKTFGLNELKAWYLVPCFKHYRTFKGSLQSTRSEIMSDTVRSNHHTIEIPQLTSANRIMEAARQLNDTIKQQPKKSQKDEITAIDLLREVLLGKRK